MSMCCVVMLDIFFFFFQAEDGIRDLTVTGVQTCALPIWFTTDPKEGRSTDYASDLAKGFDVPIVHVNADDPEACLAAVRLAMMYRAKFHNGVVIDVVGYRRWGHNEGDEPAYTQPLMYERIRQTPTV